MAVPRSSLVLSLILSVTIYLSYHSSSKLKEDAIIATRETQRLEEINAAAHADLSENKQQLASERAATERQRARANQLAERLQTVQDGANACDEEKEQLKALIHELRTELATTKKAGDDAVDSATKQANELSEVQRKSVADAAAADEALAASRAETLEARTKLKAAQDQASEWKESAERCAAEVQSAAAAAREKPDEKDDVQGDVAEEEKTEEAGEKEVEEEEEDSEEEEASDSQEQSDEDEETDETAAEGAAGDDAEESQKQENAEEEEETEETEDATSSE